MLASLLGHLAERPLHARALAREARFAGAGAVERSHELARGIVGLLLAGAPGRASPLTLETLSAALWHTIRWSIEDDRVQLLAALGDYLAFVLLSPFIGADAAIEIVTEAPRAHAPASSTRVCADRRNR